MGGFEFPDDLKFNNGAIADPEAFARAAGAAVVVVPLRRRLRDDGRRHVVRAGAGGRARVGEHRLRSAGRPRPRTRARAHRRTRSTAAADARDVPNRTPLRGRCVSLRRIARGRVARGGTRPRRCRRRAVREGRAPTRVRHVWPRRAPRTTPDPGFAQAKPRGGISWVSRRADGRGVHLGTPKGRSSKRKGFPNRTRPGSRAPSRRPGARIETTHGSTGRVVAVGPVQADRRAVRPRLAGCRRAHRGAPVRVRRRCRRRSGG